MATGDQAFAGEAALSLRGVRLAYRERRVLDDISVDFEPGALTAVIGASGCGKSTLLRLCNGLLRPDAGELRAFGTPLDYDDLPVLRRRMGYAVQGSGLFPHLSARGNITLAARVAGWSREAMEARLGELLQLTQLDPSLLPRYPHQLSGGQQQRVGLSRALFLRPAILLLDEPFAAIDPITRYDIHRQLLAILAAEPATVLLVTHDMREALLLARRILVLQGGRVAWHGEREALQARYPELPPEALLPQLLAEAER